MTARVAQVARFLAGVVVGVLIYQVLDHYGPVGRLVSAIVCGALAAFLIMRAGKRRR